MNESRNPACVKARGSSAVTTVAAASRTGSQGERRPAAPSTVTVASIQIVRCDGTPQPEKIA